MRRAIELDPHGTLAYVFLAYALESQGKSEEAVKLAEPFGPSAPLARGYAMMGRRADALKIIQALRDPMDLAVAYAAVGDASRAVDSVAKGLDLREFTAEFIKFSPLMDPLRSGARFQAQVARLKIPDVL